VARSAPTQAYTRADVRRQFKLSERQLRSWERRGLIPDAETYSFSDLIAIQTIVKLRDNRIAAPRIGQAIDALREKLDWVKAPLSELRIVSDGRRIAVHVAGQKMEALTGQILFDFDAAGLSSIKEFPEPKPDKQTSNALREAEDWFQKGLELEETGASIDEAVAAYQKVLELNPAAAGALVNLGTIYYKRKKLSQAEKYYSQAVIADPSYPLAEFNLGNIYDEQGRIEEAVRHYRRALELNPAYADAHFNLALICERTGDALKAVFHWKAYLKLDKTGHWADIARRQLERLRQTTVIGSR
jgi:tetratricopeptide (TPR) repeat protein